MNYININELHNAINLKGMKQQFYGYCENRRVKGSRHSGCEVFVPLMHAVKGIDMSTAIIRNKAYSGETPVEQLQFQLEAAGYFTTK